MNRSMAVDVRNPSGIHPENVETVSVHPVPFNWSGISGKPEKAAGIRPLSAWPTARPIRSEKNIIAAPASPGPVFLTGGGTGWIINNGTGILA